MNLKTFYRLSSEEDLRFDGALATSARSACRRRCIGRNDHPDLGARHLSNTRATDRRIQVSISADKPHP